MKLKLTGGRVDVALMNGQFCLDHLLNRVSSDPKFPPSLMLYSKKDNYVSYRHLEDNIIPQFRNANRDLVAKCFEGSKHVSHLIKYPKEYTSLVLDFLDRVHFSRIPKNSG